MQAFSADLSLSLQTREVEVRAVGILKITATRQHTFNGLRQDMLVVKWNKATPVLNRKYNADSHDLKCLWEKNQYPNKNAKSARLKY